MADIKYLKRIDENLYTDGQSNYSFVHGKLKKVFIALVLVLSAFISTLAMDTSVSAASAVNSGAFWVSYVENYSSNSYYSPYSSLPTAFLWTSSSSSVTREVTALHVTPSLGTLTFTENTIVGIDVQLYNNTWSADDGYSWQVFLYDSYKQAWANGDTSNVTSCSLKDVSTWVSAVVHCDIHVSPGTYTSFTVAITSGDPTVCFVVYRPGISTNSLINSVSYGTSTGGTGGGSSSDYNNQFNQVNNNLNTINTNISQTNALLVQQQHQQQDQYDQEKQEETEREEQQSDDMSGIGFSFNVVNPFAMLFEAFHPANSCVSIPIIASMLNSQETQYCPWFPPQVRSICTPVISFAATMLVFGFVIRWLNGGGGDGTIGSTTRTGLEGWDADGRL